MVIVVLVLLETAELDCIGLIRDSCAVLVLFVTVSYTVLVLFATEP